MSSFFKKQKREFNSAKEKPIKILNSLLEGESLNEGDEPHDNSVKCMERDH